VSSATIDLSQLRSRRSEANSKRPDVDPFDLEYIDPLEVPLELDIDVEIKPAKGMGLGAFAMRKIGKGQLVTHYDGHRVDPVTGMIYMTCAKMTQCISKLSEEKKRLSLNFDIQKNGPSMSIALQVPVLPSMEPLHAPKYWMM
jgi:hypothetical protein